MAQEVHCVLPCIAERIICRLCAAALSLYCRCWTRGIWCRRRPVRFSLWWNRPKEALAPLLDQFDVHEVMLGCLGVISCAFMVRSGPFSYLVANYRPGFARRTVLDSIYKQYTGGTLLWGLFSTFFGVFDMNVRMGAKSAIGGRRQQGD